MEDAQGTLRGDGDEGSPGKPPLLLKAGAVRMGDGRPVSSPAGHRGLVPEDERGLHLLGHLRAAQRLHYSESELEAGARPPARQDLAVPLHATLRIAVMTLGVRK